jgi:hypothetical protein
MFPNWADRVESKGPDSKSLVDLHVSRWNEWENYINNLKAAGFSEISRSERDWGKMRLKISDKDSVEYKFLAGLSEKKRKIRKKKKKGRKREYRKKRVAWATRTLKRKDDYILLDASFGSLNTPSDLDVNVVSTTPFAFQEWMKFTRAFVKSREKVKNGKKNKKEYAASFCEYWDSNFYYEPGVWDGEDVVPLTKLLMDEGFVWTTKDTALYELQCVKAYCDAYEKGKNIRVEGRVSVPRPEQMDVDREQGCYRNSLYFAEMFRRAYEEYAKGGSADQVRYAYLKYAVTKIEGLVSVTSLAVCGVFGDDVYSKYLLKEVDLEPYMYAIAGYEMVRNLRMHSHAGKYKSKYANRLRYALYDTPGLCKKCRKLERFVDVDGLKEELSVKKSNKALLSTMTKSIAVFLDFMDDKSDYGEQVCPYVNNSDKWLANLNGTLKDLCDRAYDYIDGVIKEETSNKSKGVDYVGKLIEDS